jgi:hypothetical protein
MSQPTPSKYPDTCQERVVQLAVESEPSRAVHDNTGQTGRGTDQRPARQEQAIHHAPLSEELTCLRKEKARVQAERALTKGYGVLGAPVGVTDAGRHQPSRRARWTVLGGSW